MNSTAIGKNVINYIYWAGSSLYLDISLLCFKSVLFCLVCSLSSRKCLLYKSEILLAEAMLLVMSTINLFKICYLFLVTRSIVVTYSFTGTVQWHIDYIASLNLSKLHFVSGIQSFH